MLPDPLVVTVDGSAKSMPRTSVNQGAPSMRLDASATYNTSDGSHTVETRRMTNRVTGMTRLEITLRKRTLDVDVNTVHNSYVYAGVGYVFEFGPFGADASTITSLRTALASYVDATILSRILAGEV